MSRKDNDARLLTFIAAMASRSHQDKIEAGMYESPLSDEIRALRKRGLIRSREMRVSRDGLKFLLAYRSNLGGEQHA
jgi:hypothetical protein